MKKSVFLLSVRLDMADVYNLYLVVVALLYIDHRMLLNLLGTQ